MLFKSTLPIESPKVVLAIVLCFELLFAFTIYVYTEKRIDHANEQRQISYMLADELRQSSDDLTRMARTYVVTGDPRYKTYYQDILDIRNGKMPRPDSYSQIYWDLVLSNDLPTPHGNGQAIALLELMRRTGFPDEELSMLTGAKANSDALANLELDAMKLAESSGPDKSQNRAKAILMLHDKNYHLAKAAIMRPINQFYDHMGRRTAAAVRAAENIAIFFRALFLLLMTGIIFILWRTYANMRSMLGGQVEEVHANILRISQGDLSTPINVPAGMECSVLAGLSKMQDSLLTTNIQRMQIEDALRESEARFRTLCEDAPEAILIHDLDSGLFVDATTSAERLFACSRDEILQHGPQYFYAPVQPKNAPTFESIRERGLRILAGEEKKFERLVLNRKGQEILCEVRLVRLPSENRKLIRASYIDITERKLAETELRIAATTFDSQESFMITDAKGVILRVNKAFTESTGYTAEEAVGQTPRILKSGRHDQAFYQKMWEEINRTGTWKGEIWDKRKNGDIFLKWLSISAVRGSDGAITHYVGSHIDITERKEAEEKIQQLAFQDSLTRLPNRLLLLDRLQQSMTSSSRGGRQGAVLFIDLDNFKSINDSLGHNIGDLLLQQVAKRLTASVREGDTVARLGGDEFVVILEDLSEQSIEAAEQTEAVGRKILAHLGMPYQLAEHEVYSSASIGATVFSGDNQAVQDLLKQADIAMYQAKKMDRNTLRFFDIRMQDTINAKAKLESELHKALDNEQFQLYYQIQVDSTGRGLGAEALIRWNHPEKGLVSPAQFIPLAEESGLILPIGQWVLDTSCAQIKAWAYDEQTRDLVLAVNISARQFRQADFVAQVKASIERHAVNPHLLKLELTESVLLEDVNETVATMNALKEIGVRLSLDDFGTGYSSLQYLKLLPLNQIKIDQSFVRDLATDPNDAAIVRTVIAMSLALGLEVIAEGVETEEQLDFLQSSECHAFQGYLFSKPLPIEQFSNLLRP